MPDRLKLIEIPSHRPQLDFASAVYNGLRSIPKALPSRFFYDHRGSELFEQITELPEYYLTRCEAAIFEKYRKEIVQAAGPELSLVEFGSGSSTKTRLLIEAILSRQSKLDYAPIDISEGFLAESSQALLQDHQGLRITALAGEYFDGIRAMPDFDRPRLILFLGSNIGNFDGQEAIRFLSGLQNAMNPDDRLLLGTDLVKDPQIIRAAYNDRAGVTAEFNLNLLARVNAELRGTFDLSKFAHSAAYLEAEQRIEARLVSQRAQQACISALNLSVSFEEGESIHTEYSQKYTEQSIQAIADQAGLQVEQRWTDERGWFAVNLLRSKD